MTSEVPPSELVNVMLVLSSGDILYEKFLKTKYSNSTHTK